MTNKLAFVTPLVTQWFLTSAPSPSTASVSQVDWSLMKFVNEIIRSLRAFARKTGALLGTTFVLSLHAVFHNVICNWRNRAVQFLSIIVLGCPLQRIQRAHGRPISRVLSRILWIFEQAERFCDGRGPSCHCPRLLSRYVRTRKYSDLG